MPNSSSVSFCVILWLIGFAYGGEFSSNPLPDLDDVLEAIQKVMLFFLDRYELMNVDAVLGVRIAQGEMIKALAKAETGKYPLLAKDLETKRKMSEIRDISEQIGQLTVPLIKERDPLGYKRFRVMLLYPFKMYELPSHKILKFNKSLLPALSKETNSDTLRLMSDVCMGTLTVGGCDVNTCWNIMTKMRTKFYATTHQILWLQLGIHACNSAQVLLDFAAGNQSLEFLKSQNGRKTLVGCAYTSYKAGCRTKLEAKAKQKFGSLNNLLEILCSSVVYQMKSLYKGGTIKKGDRDLFMEQGAICGNMGFVDATSVTWLENILRWQDPEFGCYKAKFESPKNESTQGISLNNTQKSWRSRKLFGDVRMGDNCSAHESSTGVGYLAANTRLYLDPVYRSYQLLPALRKGDEDLLKSALEKKN